MTVPYPLIEQSALERRLDDAAEWQDHLGLSDSEWDQTLTDIIEEESAFVAGELADENIAVIEYGDASELTAAYPVVRRAMVRLCRAALNNIPSDGLTSETVGDHSEDYRPPSDLRAEVANELAGIGDGGGSGSGDDGFRTEII